MERQDSKELVILESRITKWQSIEMDLTMYS
jgi:hypothetical protein